MRTSALALMLLATLALPASALSVNTLTQTQLREAGARLAEHAGSSQWQQLWARSRAAGYFAAEGHHHRFTLPMRDIPPVVRQTLAAPDHVQVQGQTRTQMRRDFAPDTIGTVDGRRLTAVCLVIDWRGASDRRQDELLENADLTYVTLSSARPC
jgi:hypothetical protein